jgi:ElaB/YqjD/DUF883 family membrane-anchored ribosome-binding protein
MIDEDKARVIESARKDFIEMNDTVDQLLVQFNAFGSEQTVYVLRGDINKFKQDLKRMNNLLDRIQNDLAKDGTCIIEPTDKVS